MRNKLIPLLLLLPALLALLRSKSGPLLVGQESYTFLTQTNLPAQHYFLFATICLALLLGLFILLQKKYGLPYEYILVLSTIPAYLASTLTAGIHFVLAIIVVLAVLYWKNNLVLFLLALMSILVHSTGMLLAFVAVIAFAKRKNIIYPFILLVAMFFFFETIHLQTTPLLTELGYQTGIAMISVLLALIGVFVCWTKTTYRYLLALLFLLALGLFMQELVLVGALAAAVLAGLGIHAMREQEWNIEAIKNTTLLFMWAGLLYSGVTGIVGIVEAAPTQDAQDAIDILLKLEINKLFIAQEHAPYFSYHEISSVSEEEINTQKRSYADNSELPNVLVLHKNDKADGLRFLVENTEVFTLIHKSNTYKIWELSE